MNVKIIDSPIGKLTLMADENALRAVYMETSVAPQGELRSTPLLERAAVQLEEYFAGKRTDFDLPLEPIGTEFQTEVWKALTKIPFGQTCSYADIARTIRRPKAMRAVGAANGQNPIAVIVPCHRVIGADGSLTGYGGGLPRKKWLLSHESGQLELE